MKLTRAEAGEYLRDRIDPKGAGAFRRPWLQQWIKNVAFMNGRQHFVDDGNGYLRTPQTQPHQVLYKANHIGPAVYRACTKALSTQVSFSATPVNGSERATNTNFVTMKVLDHLRNITKFDDKKWNAAVWAAVCGSAILKPHWNPERGVPDRFYWRDMKTKAPVVPDNDEERSALEARGLYEDSAPGEVDVSVHSMFEFYWDPNAKDMEGCRWINFRYLTTKSAIEDSYPDIDGEKLGRGSEIGEQSAYYQYILNFMSSALAGPNASISLPRGQVAGEEIIVDEFYEIPNRKSPRGKMIVRAGDTVIRNLDNPYARIRGLEPWETLPAIKLDWLTRPGSFVGKGMVEEMIHAQFQYNRSRAQIIQHGNVYGQPPVFLFKGSGLPSGQWALEPGLVYDTNVPPGQKIFEVGPTPNLSKEVVENGQQCLGDLQRLSAQDVQDMRFPGQARSNEGIGMLRDERDMPLLPTAKGVLKADLECGRRLLAMAKEFYTTQRTLRYAGPDREIEVIDFDRADINHDIQIVGEPQYFHTRASQEERIKAFLAAGLWDPVNNPEDKLDILKALQVGSADEMIHERLQDEKNQRREIREMSEAPEKYLGMDEAGSVQANYPIEEFDDDATHLKVLRRHIKGDEFRRASPVSKHLIMSHAQQHQQRLQAIQAQQLAMLQAQQGSSGGKGQPSRPKTTAQ